MNRPPTPDTPEPPQNSPYTSAMGDKTSSILSWETRKIPWVESVRNALLKHIKQDGNFQKPWDLYHFLTTRPEILALQSAWKVDFSAIKQANILQANWYNNTVRNFESTYQGDGDPAWMSITCSGKWKPSGAISYKWYRTVPLREYAFLKHLPLLLQKLTEEGERKNAKISIKVPRSFLWFLGHNDSIVIHSDDPDIEVDTLLSQWSHACHTPFESRHLGRTTFSLDGARNPEEQKTSFTDLVEKQVLNHGNALLKQGYDPESVVDTMIQGAITLSQKAPTIH